MIQDSIGLDSLRNNLLAVRRTWRAWRGQDLLQRPQMRCQTLTLGSDGSVWSICRSSLSSQSVVYSVGVGEEISFDLELIHRFGVTVHAFDPTPRSIAWVQSRPLPPEFVFHSYGIAGQDGMRRFVPPANQNFVSHTLLERETPWPAVEVQVRRISSVQKILGHAHIDLLKMDIEGAEYEVIDDLLASPVPVRQLLVEFHHRWPEVGIAKTRTAIRKLNAAGYRIFSVSPSGEEYGFLAAGAG